MAQNGETTWPHGGKSFQPHGVWFHLVPPYARKLSGPVSTSCHQRKKEEMGDRCRCLAEGFHYPGDVFVGDIRSGRQAQPLGKEPFGHAVDIGRSIFEHRLRVHRLP